MAGDAPSIASIVLDALADKRQREPFTDADPDFSIADAYAVTAELRRMRIARGERPVGRKIGFTNRNIWAEYGVFEPIWGDIYESGMQTLEPGGRVGVGHLPEPRIEPEIVLGIERDLSPGMGLREIASSVGWVAHGFEIVQSIFPGWRFRAADCVADGGLHGALVLGPRHDVREAERAALPARLSGLRMMLRRNGQAVDTGSGANVLDGPIEALAHLVEVLGKDKLNPQVKAGEMVTTGTLTRAFPIFAGERWSTEIHGYDLSGLSAVIG